MVSVLLNSKQPASIYGGAIWAADAGGELRQAYDQAAGVISIARKQMLRQVREEIEAARVFAIPSVPAERAVREELQAMKCARRLHKPWTRSRYGYP